MSTSEESCEPCRRSGISRAALHQYELAHKGERPCEPIPICAAHAQMFQRFAGQVRSSKKETP